MKTQGDYEKLEANSRAWDDWGFQFTRCWFAQRAANEPDPPPASYWNPVLEKDGRIYPQSKNWCHHLIVDDEDTIHGRFFSVGITEEFCLRHLDPDEPGAIFPTPWSNLYVPDPARTETGRCAVSQVMVDFSNPALASLMIHASARNASLFKVDVLLAQTMIDPQDSLGGVLAERYGFRKIRSLPLSPIPQRPDAKKDAHIEIWAWERSRNLLNPASPTMSDLSTPVEGIALLARFYQSLSERERQVLHHSLRGNDRNLMVDKVYITVNRIDQLTSSIREKLLEIKDDLVTVGVPFAPGKHPQLNTLLLPLTDVLHRIEWFYGEEEDLEAEDLMGAPIRKPPNSSST